MEFRILGPLEVVERSRSVPLTGQKQRALLSMLLLHANEVVSSDRLIEALWGDRPPETAQTALQVHISQLRKLLDAGRIETRPPGYKLRAAPEELDLAHFEELLAADDDQRPARVREALALWRGPVLAEFAYEPFAQVEIARLEELRLGALEEQIDSELALGRHADVVSDLEGLVREHPFRERPRAQLMLALYRGGRQAEALALYQETRRVLVEELGIEPGSELQELHRQVLNQDPALAAPPLQEGEPALPPAPREERKVVTVLFCDLVGFTLGAEQLDPEDVGALLTPFYVRLRAELERHGGTVEKFIGDAVMALFGAPVAHEDDAERAVRAALTIRDWIAEQSDELEVRIGVGTGEALVQIGAQSYEGEPMAVGDVVNTTMRLQQAAPPGAVVIGEATYRATRDDIVYEQLDPVHVKGKSEPVPLWMAKRLRSRVAEREAPTPFIGRENDIALLRQAYARALHESSVQLVTIVGEPGIGKTRLAAEFRARVEEQADKTLWRQGRCLSYGEGITFWALGEIVKTHAGILESDTPDDVATKLAAAVDQVAEGADRQWLFARLAPLVGAARDEQQVEQAEAFAAWCTFLEGVAAHQPLVLVFEDLHWADSALLAFLDHLVDWSADVPLLVVGTARPELYEREPGWGGGKRNSTTASLVPLTKEDTARLIGALLAPATLPPQTQTALLARAGGNPLYAEEFVRMLGDRGLLTHRDGVLELAEDAEISVPEGVHAVIAARLDTLNPDRKALLHDAAVVGKVFWAGALAAMGRVPKESVLAGLHELVRKELVRRTRSSSIADDVEYTFWHVLVRDVAYTQIPRVDRGRKHVVAAQWIERIAGERISDHAEFLAHHYRTALELVRTTGGGDPTEPLLDAAVRFGTLAAERAARLDHARGERYYRDALTLLSRDDPRRPKLLADAANIGTTAGVSFERIKDELEQAISAFRAQGDPVGAANALRQLSFAMYGRKESLVLADEARRLLEPLPPGPELALVYARLAQEELIAWRTQEGRAWSEKALPLLERFGLDDEALVTRSRLASARSDLGDQAALEELRQIAHEALDPDRGYGTHPVASVLNNLAVAEALSGAGPGAAAEALRAAVELAGRRGLERPRKWYEANLVESLYDLGEWDEALRLNEEIIAWERVKGQSTIGMIGSPSAAKILTARGQLDAATALVDELLPHARGTEHSSMLLPLLTAAAAVASAAGESTRAVACLEEFEQFLESVRDALGCVTEIGRVCAATGQLLFLERLLDDLGADPRIARFASTAGAILSEARGDHAGADCLYAEAEAGWKVKNCVVEHAHALLGLGRCRVALGRSDEAAGPLGEGRAIFLRLNAGALLAETEELLAEATTVSS